ncbi:MAG: motility protein A [Desulfonatronovibrionaceae bacterium]
MINRTIAAGFIFFAVFSAGFMLSGQPGMYFNVTAMVVVLSGTLGAGCLSFGPSRVRQALARARSAYQEDDHGQKRLVDSLMSLGHLHRRHGIVNPESIRERFPEVSRGLELVKDGYKEEEIREIISSEAVSRQISSQELERVFRSMAAYAPSFGVAGSVIGLVGLLMGMEDTSLILKNIPVTLVSTLYGIVLANFFLLPAAEKISQKTDMETRETEIILCAMVNMRRGADFLKLQRMLNAMVLHPWSRVEDTGAFRRISAGFRQQKKTRSISGENPVQARAD